MDRTDSSPRVAGRISSGILRECTRFERTLRRGTAKLRGEIARLRGRGWRLHHCRGGLPLVRHHGLPIEFAREVGTRPWSASSLSATQPDNASRRITHRDETTGLTCGCAVRDASGGVVGFGACRAHRLPYVVTRSMTANVSGSSSPRYAEYFQTRIAGTSSSGVRSSRSAVETSATGVSLGAATARSSSPGSPATRPRARGPPHDPGLWRGYRPHPDGTHGTSRWRASLVGGPAVSSRSPWRHGAAADCQG